MVDVDNPVEDDVSGPCDEGQTKKVSDEQMYSAMSFAVMLLLVGIPLWWKTTEVYRVSLPYYEIDELADDLRISLNVHIVPLEKARGEKLVQEIENLFRLSPVYNARIKVQNVSKSLLGSCKTLNELQSKVNHPKYEGSVQLLEVPGLSRFTQQKIIIGENRTIFFSTEADSALLYNKIQSYFLSEEHLTRTMLHVRAPPEGKLDAECSKRVSPSPAYDVLLTVLNPEPDRLKLDIDLPKAIKEYLNPLLHELSEISEFHVKSQWLYFVNLEVKPVLVEANPPFFGLTESKLTQVITPLEKKLSSQVSKNPSLNLVVWVPACAVTPLHIYSDDHKIYSGRDAFLSPRWGGIQIYNPNSGHCDGTEKLSVKPDMREIMPIFLQQVRLLLGLRDLQADVIAGHVSSSNVPVRSWEKDYLLRSRTVEQLTIAKRTLRSLSKLLGKISNIVINDHIGEAIYGSLEAIKSCEQSLHDGKLLEAYKYSQQAFVLSEAAFSDPSLLALLYFPEDQKYAVYIPLFLPVMIPVLISFKPLREWIVKKLLNNGNKPKIE